MFTTTLKDTKEKEKNITQYYRESLIRLVTASGDGGLRHWKDPDWPLWHFVDRTPVLLSECPCPDG
jgi:hypothetical protein